MFRSYLLLFFTLTTILLQAQSREYLGHIRLLDNYLKCYESLSPWGEQLYSLKACGISKDVANQIMKEHVDTFDSITDSLDFFDLQTILKVLIGNELEKTVHHVDFEGFPLDSFLQSKSLDIVISPDRKLWNFSYFENTGGTYHSKVSYMHYQGLTSKELMSFDRFESEFFHPDGYSIIQQFEDQGTVYYVLIGGAKTCGTCMAEYLNIVYFDGEKLSSNFSITLDFRYWISNGYEISFDSESKELMLRFVSNEKDVDCLEIFSANLMAYEIDEELAKQCECRFRFQEGHLKPLECKSSVYVNEY